MFNLFSAHFSIALHFVHLLWMLFPVISFVNVAHEEICIRSSYLHEVVPELVG